MEDGQFHNAPEPAEEPRLPRVPEPEQYFALAGKTVEYSVPPRTPEELYAHTATSMMAIGIVMSLNIKERLAALGVQAERTTESIFFGDATGQGTTAAGIATTRGGIAEAVVEHNTTEYGDYYSFPLPIKGMVGEHTERAEADGRVHSVVQVQPPVLIDDLSDDASLEEIYAALLRTEQETADNVEYTWDSTEPDKVLLHRGESSIELSGLDLQSLMKAARLLRRVAITTAAVSNNQAVLEALLPPEHEVKRGHVPRRIARALRLQEALEGQPPAIEDAHAAEAAGNEVEGTESPEEL